MKKRENLILLLIVLLLTFSVYVTAQEPVSVTDKVFSFPGKLITHINKKAADLNNRIDKQTEKYIERLQRKEQKLAKKLYNIDSAAAQKIYNASTKAQYSALLNKIKNDTSTTAGKQSGEYLANVDSVKGGLSFLQTANVNAPALSAEKSKITSALGQVNQLQNKLQDAEAIKQFIRERKQQIKEVLSKYTNLPGSIRSSFEAYNRQGWYYAAQIKEFKDLLNDPDKLEQKALSLLNQLPGFAAFMKEHSELAGLFNIPGNYGSSQALAGLQTRDQVQQLIISQMGGGPNAGQLFGQQVQAAQQQLNQYKDKLSALGNNSGDIDMPNFKPNTQKTKTFFQRLEYGTNLQTNHGSYYYPLSTELGVTAAYRLNNKSSVGVGMAGRIGWGKDIQHIAISGQGFSIRSFGELRLKGSFFGTAGLEYNYQQPFNSMQQINGLNSWSASGLAGISKVVSIKTKLFKKTRVSLLWDYLSYSQKPVTQAWKFRVGYMWH